MYTVINPDLALTDRERSVVSASSPNDAVIKDALQAVKIFRFPYD